MPTAKKTTTKKSATRTRTGATRGRKAKDGATAPAAEKKATVGKRRPTVAKTEAKPRGPSLLEAACEVLKRVDEPVGAKDLITRIIDEGLWTTQGKTPEATLYSAMIREIAGKGAEARFQKVSRGRFTLTDAAWKA